MKIAFVYMNRERNIGRGAGYIVASIRDSYPEYKLHFFDTRFDKGIANDIIKGKFDILMVSTMTLMFSGAMSLISEVKKKRKNITVLVGGIHPTIMGSNLLEKHFEIDYLCIGEGESFIKDFLKHYGKKSLFNIENLAFREGGKIHTNPLRPPEDLSTLPHFPWSIFNKKSTIIGGNKLLYVTATRGCPYNCSYCCNGVYLKLYKGKYLRSRPVDQVIKELKKLKKIYNPGLLYFGDDMILFDTQYITELFTALKKEVKVPYGCMGRVEKIDQDIIKLLASTGCKYMAMGVECGDEEFRKRYLNRHMTNDQIINAFSMCRKAGIFTTSFNIIGYPFPNDNKLTKHTIKFNRMIKPNRIQVTIFYPFPGTKLYEHCIKNKLINYKQSDLLLTYHADSVLKGYDLKSKRLEINAEFNSNVRSIL